MQIPSDQGQTVPPPDSGMTSKILAEKSVFAKIREELMVCRRQKEKPAVSLSEQVFEDLMQLAATAGMAIAHTGTSIPHGLSYPNQGFCIRRFQITAVNQCKFGIYFMTDTLFRLACMNGQNGIRRYLRSRRHEV
mgnify:CR=1 FL=1